MTVNPLNCITCENKEPIPTPRWASETPLRLGERCKITKQKCKKKFTSAVGCASHSDQRIMPITNNKLCEICSKNERADERGNVLDELKTFCKEKGTNWAYDKWTMVKLIEFAELHKQEE